MANMLLLLIEYMVYLAFKFYLVNVVVVLLFHLMDLISLMSF